MKEDEEKIEFLAENHFQQLTWTDGSYHVPKLTKVWSKLG